MKVLVTDRLAQEALDLLRSQHETEVMVACPPDRLAEIIGEYDALVVRSQTRVTADLLKCGRRLKVIARAGVGVDSIDVEEATRRGIPVVNVPNGNVLAATEHTFALMLALARHIPEADAAVRAGDWPRGRLEGVELNGKALGIVGLGRIGSEVAKRAQVFGMRVLAHDPLVAPEQAARLGVELVSLDALLVTCDFLSVHVPGAPSTRKLIGERELAIIKPGCRVINCARGGVIDEAALLRALDAGRVAGAALDVFDGEPVVNEALRRCDRVVLTPHIAGSTQEARVRIGLEVAREVLAALEGRPLSHPVNLPTLSADEWRQLHPYLTLAGRLGAIGAGLIEGQLEAVTVETCGEELAPARRLLTSAALVSLLSAGNGEGVNLVNSYSTASARGLTIREGQRGAAGRGDPELLLRLETTSGDCELLGGVVRGAPHMLKVNGHWLQFAAQGRLLFSQHREGTGIIGTVGTFLGRHGLSISFIQLGRTARGGEGLMVLGLDDAVPPATLEEMRTLPSVVWMREIILPVDPTSEP